MPHCTRWICLPDSFIICKLQKSTDDITKAQASMRDMRESCCTLPAAGHLADKRPMPKLGLTKRRSGAWSRIAPPSGLPCRWSNFATPVDRRHLEKETVCYGMFGQAKAPLNCSSFGKSSPRNMVDVTGIEPVPPCLQRTKLASNNSTAHFNYW